MPKDDKSAKTKPTFKIVFRHQDKLIELYAHEVAQSSMMAFIEVGDIIFDNRTDVVIDPAEEKLKAEFEGVKRSYIPMHAVVRIDEVDKKGVNKIRSLSDADKSADVSSITPFPFPHKS